MPRLPEHKVKTRQLTLLCLVAAVFLVSRPLVTGAQINHNSLTLVRALVS